MNLPDIPGKLYKRSVARHDQDTLFSQQ